MITISSIIFDITMVAVIIVAVLIGKHKGFLMTAYMLGVVVIAIFLGKLCMPFVTAGLCNLNISDKIHAGVYDTMMEVADNNPDVNLVDLSSKLRLPESMVEAIEKNINESVNATGKELVEAISSFVTEAAVNIISYILVALIVIAILLVIFVLLKLAKKIPVLGKIDEIGGGIIGCLIGIAIVFIFCGIFYAYGLSHNEGIIADISGHSYVLKGLDYIGFFRVIIK